MWSYIAHLTLYIFRETKSVKFMYRSTIKILITCEIAIPWLGYSGSQPQGEQLCFGWKSQYLKMPKTTLHLISR